MHNLGSRACTCAANVFDCGACSVDSTHPLFVPPDAPLPNCLLEDALMEDDSSGCTDNERCQSISNVNRFCGCLGQWDCDTKPADFGG